MDKYERRRMKIEGMFILHLRMQEVDLPISAIREMSGHYRTLAKLETAKIVTVSELCSADYEKLEGIVGDKKADFIIHLLGLYGLRAVPSRVVTADVTTADITP